MEGSLFFFRSKKKIHKWNQIYFFSIFIGIKKKENKRIIVEERNSCTIFFLFCFGVYFNL
jgi:hypothetical protein